MSLTKSEARTLIREFIDDPDAKLWGDTNLDLLTALVLDDLWGDLLRQAPNYRSALDDVTSANHTSPGYIDLGSAGPLSQRFYRLQSVTREDTEYTPVDPRDIAIMDDEVVVNEAAPRTYYVRGEQLWLFPLSTGEATEVRYSSLPASYDDLADGGTVVWPDGFENAFIFEAAGRALLKGGRESESGKEMLSMGRAVLDRLLARLDRQHPAPVTPWTSTSPEAWGSVRG